MLTDWTASSAAKDAEERVLLATEIVFAGDVVGSGSDWSITTGLADDLSIKLLRAVQRKVAHAPRSSWSSAVTLRGRLAFRLPQQHVIKKPNGDDRVADGRRDGRRIILSLHPVWEHERVADGLPEDEPPPVSSGIMVTRIEPPSPYEDSWRIVNEATPADVLGKVLQQMGEVLPHYVGLLDRTELPGRLEELFGPVRAWRLRGWLLAESGPSDELDQLLSEREGTNPNARGAAELIRDYAATKAPRS